jgi:hypothetical protein
MWDNIMEDVLRVCNKMVLHIHMSDEQKMGLIVCLPKTAHPNTLKGYRPITLLNCDYKILARIIANRLWRSLPDVIHPGQHCGVGGRHIFDAAGGIRDVIAYAEFKRMPLCLFSLDFFSAFDCISHNYFSHILEMYGYHDQAIGLERSLFKNTTFKIQINGSRSGPIPIRCSVRLGCPLSMLLFILALNSLLYRIDKCLKGIEINYRQRTAAVIAYANDVTNFLKGPWRWRWRCYGTSGRGISSVFLSPPYSCRQWAVAWD